MSNSFNIDVKPEIAEIAADIAAAIVTVNANSSGLATSIISDLVDINTAIVDSQAAVLESITTNLALTDAKINVNLAAIDIIDGIVDAIKLKTDATPQNVRGNFNKSNLSTANAALQDVVNITGHGKLYLIGINCASADDTIEIKVTIDGDAFLVASHTGDTTTQIIIPDVLSPSAASAELYILSFPSTEPRLFNIEFDTSLLIQIRRSAGTAGNVNCKVYYSLDSF